MEEQFSSFSNCPGLHSGTRAQEPRHDQSWREMRSLHSCCHTPDLSFSINETLRSHMFFRPSFLLFFFFLKLMVFVYVV